MRWPLMALVGAMLAVFGPAPAAQRRSVEADERQRRDIAALSDVLDRLRKSDLAGDIPSANEISRGNLTIEAGRTVTGSVVVFAGTLRVLGRIEGDAIALHGDVVVDSGGEVTGDVVAYEGSVQRRGTIGGATKTLTGMGTSGGEAQPPARSRSDVGLSLSWLGVLLLIGVGVLVFAQRYLEGVVETLEARFWRSFFAGVALELALVPAFVLMVAALAITVIGILLIPFAAVAYVLAVAGLLTLGFVAVARLTGGAVRSDAARRLSARGSALRGVLVGTTLLLGMWVVSAALAGIPLLGIVLRSIAAIVTYAAVTAGLGATFLSRAGTRGVEAAAAKPVDPAVWQTPTPVSGVVAARRPAGAGSAERR